MGGSLDCPPWIAPTYQERGLQKEITWPLPARVSTIIVQINAGSLE